MGYIPRLFVNFPLHKGDIIAPEKTHHHYLFKVMRAKDKDKVLLFNGKDGEWQAEVQEKKLHLITQTHKQPTDEQGIHLYCSPIKRNMDFLVEKVTELGVMSITPVIMAHTVQRHFKAERLKKIMVEASEQCDRLTIPTLNPPIKFHDLIIQEQGIIACTETGGQPINKAILLPSPHILIGPEGGFSSQELDFLDKHKIPRLSLGKRLLRAETAAIAITAYCQIVTLYGPA